MKSVGNFLWAAILIACLSACSSQVNRSNKTPVYLLSAKAASSLHADQLVSESALKLTEIEAALQANRDVKYIPLDHVDSLPDTAYPRLRVSVDRSPGTPDYMRIVRKDDQWFYYSSHDGKNFDLIGKYELEMPRTCFAGVYIGATGKDEDFDSHVIYLSINGKKVDKPDIICTDGCNVSLKPDGIHLHAESKTADWSLDSAALAGEMVDGDFTVEAQFKPYPKGSNVFYSGIICREESRKSTPAIIYYYNNTWVAAAYRHDNMSYGLAIDRSFYPKYIVSLKKDAASEYTEIGRYAADFSTWRDMIDSVQALTEIIRNVLQDNLDIKYYRSPKPASLSHLQNQQLRNARNLALGQRPIDCLMAAGQVNNILNKIPNCPSAWTVGAMCVALPCVLDLEGWFHNRDRYLASSLSELLMAKRLFKDQNKFSDADILNEAWVMLACGYPDAALENCRRVKDAGMFKDEILALNIFTTDNYMLAEGLDMHTAWPLITVAWQRALIRCGRTPTLYDFDLDRARESRSDYFIPSCKSLSVGFDHGRTRLGLSIALARDIRDILMYEDFAESQKREMLSEIYKGVYKDDGLENISNRLAWQAMNEPDEQTMSLLAGLLIKARRTDGSIAYVDETGRQTFNTFPLHDYADLRLGNFIMRMSRRMHFLGDRYGVPEYAIEAAHSFGNIFRNHIPAVTDMFDIYALKEDQKHDEVIGKLDRFVQSDFGHMISSKWEIFNSDTRSYFKKYNAGQIKHLGGRGAWNQEMIAYTQRNSNGKSSAITNSYSCMKIAPYSLDAAVNIAAYKISNRHLQQLADIAPYHLKVLRYLTSYTKDIEKKMELLKRRVALAPKEYTGYTMQACLLLEDEKVDEAIKLYRQARMKCPYSVGISSSFGSAAGKLADKGYLSEALEFGKYASRSGSAGGEIGYAKALEAAERYQEASKIYRSVAVRYRNCVHTYFEYMLRMKLSDKFIADEMSEMLKEHPAYANSIASKCMWKFRRFRDRPELIKILSSVVFKDVPLKKISLQTIVGFMAAKAHNNTADFGLRLIEEKIITNTQCYWAYYAAKMCGRADDMKLFLAEMQQYKDDKLIGLHVRYLNGEFTDEQLISKSERDIIPRAYTNWTLGQEAEIAGNIDRAYEFYRKATEDNANTQTNSVSSYWIEDRNKAGQQ